jgi:solute:Na+ symporter, SSS family
MMNEVGLAEIPWFWVTLIGYLAMLMLFGLWSKKRTKSVSDYLVAGRQIGPVLLGLSFGTTYFSSVLLIGGGGLAAVWGLAVIWIAAIDVLVGVVCVFLFHGRRTLILSAKCNAMTVPQMLGYRYQDKNLQAFQGAVLFFFEMIYVVSIVMGLSKLLTLLVPEGASQAEKDNAYVIGVVICAVITAVYLSAGGSFGAIVSDSVESLVMVAGVLCIFFLGLNSVGGWDGMMAGLAKMELAKTAGGGGFGTNAMTTAIGFGGMGILGYILVTSFGQWGMPQALSRFFTAKKRASIKWGLIVAACWAAVVSFFAWINGVIAASYWWLHTPDAFKYIAQIYNPPVPYNLISGKPPGDLDMNIPLFLRYVLPPGVGAVFIAATTAAAMTTDEKVILVSASGLAQDMYQNIKERKGDKIPDEKMLKITRLSTILVVGVSLLLALTKPALVLNLCMFAWSAMAATILVPMIFGLFWKKATTKAAWISGIAALAAAVLWWVIFRSEGDLEVLFHDWRTPQISWNDPITGVPFTIALGDYVDMAKGKLVKNGIHEFIVSEVVSVVTFIVVSMFSKPPNKEFVDGVFEDFKYQKALKKAAQEVKAEE